MGLTQRVCLDLLYPPSPAAPRLETGYHLYTAIYNTSANLFTDLSHKGIYWQLVPSEKIDHDSTPFSCETFLNGELEVNGAGSKIRSLDRQCRL
jgi:hypothetical protein